MSKAVKKKFGGFPHPIKIESDIGLITVKRAQKKVTLSPSQIRGVRVEKLWGAYKLTIETDSKVIKFKQSEKACNKAMAYLVELTQ
jgi:hypothetical protein